MRGWKFLAILSSCFVPNNKDIYYLRKKDIEESKRNQQTQNNKNRK